MTQNTSQDSESHGTLSHVLGPSTLVGTFAALIGLTVLTVLLASFPLGAAEVWVSLIIASVKAFLVAAYFMHLRYDNPFNSILVGASIITLALFLIFTLADSAEYQDDLIPPNLGTPSAADSSMSPPPAAD